MMKKIEIAILCLFSFFLLQMLDVQAQTPLKKAVAGLTFQVPCERIDSLVSLARTKNGCHYKHAGSGPNVFDCSGFTMWVYKQFGVSLPHGSVTQYTLGKKVSKADLRPGDLVFFYRSRCVGHVGLVVSVDSVKGATYIHASTYKTGVRYNQLNSSKSFVGARRIFECEGMPQNSPEVADSVKVAEISVADTTQSTPAVAPAPAPQPAPKPQPSYFYHKVKKGETLSHLARRYHTTVAKIQKWNRLKSPDYIREGQRLKIYR